MVVGVDAELNELSVDDVNEAEDVIVSQWREVSASEKHEMRQGVDELLRPLGYETSLLVIRRASSIAVLFTCLTLAAVMNLRDQWRSHKLREIVEKLFSLFSRARQTIRIKRLIWPLTDFERCLHFFDCIQGKQTIYNNVNCCG